MKSPSNQAPRRPSVAGQFYPAGEKQLRSELEQFFLNVTPKHVKGIIRGLVTPHAGYMYSGSVAAAAYKMIEGTSIDTAVVIAPSHRDPFSGVSVYAGQYSTPLGIIPPDSKIINALTELSPVITISDLGHRNEHSLEVQLPFLQYCLKDFSLVPLVMGSQNWKTCAELGEALAQVLDPDRSIIIASSDLSHYHDQSSANRLDRLIIEAFNAFDAKTIYDDIMSGKCEACGAGPIITAMIASEKLGAQHAEVICYQTSGEVSNDYSQVVGYLAGVLYT